MKRFRERNPFWVGVVGGVVLVAIALLTYYAKDLPLVGGGTTYRAEFTEAAGLKKGDEVRVAGVKVGEVTGVELAGDHALIRFRVKDVWLGDQTTAVIKIKTVLGQKDLVLDPLGTNDLDPRTPIPRTRTVSPYELTDALGDLSKTVARLDTTQLADSFRTLSQTFTSTTPDEVRTTLDGLATLSKTISGRDQELKQLLDNTGKFSKTIADRTQQIETLVSDSGVLLRMLSDRRKAIGTLLRGTQDLSRQLSGVIEDNRARIAPALTQLDHVTDVLRRNEDKLDRALRLAGPFYRLVGNAISNGRWLDTYLCGLVAAPGGGCRPPKPGGGR